MPLLLYAACVLFVTAHHEPWRDEADQWMVARDNGLGGLLRLTGYMGHPSLWYLILMPLTRLGVSYEAALFVNTAIAIAAAGLLLARAPFPLWMRCLIAFSFFPAYEYAVIARSYALTMLLVFALASLDERRTERPFLYGALIAALANTNTHGLVIAAGWGALLVADWLQGERSGAAFKAASLALLGGVASVLQLWPPEDGQTLVADPPLTVVPKLFASVVIPGYGERGVHETALALHGLAIGVMLWFLWPRPRAFCYFAGVTATLISLFLFVYIGGPRHAGLITLVGISAAWIGSARSPLPGARVAGLALTIPLAISTVYTAIWWTLDYRGEYSGARRMAAYIIENGLSDRPIAAYPDGKAMAVLAHLPRETFWYAGRGAEGSHMTWDAAYVEAHRFDVNQAIGRIDRAFPDEPELLILLNAGFRNPEAFGARLLFASNRRVFGHPEERFYLYERIAR